MSVRATRKDDLSVPALQLVEESVYLLRRAPLHLHLWYCAGTLPWCLAVLLYWSFATWFAPLGDRLAWQALGLALLFVNMKVCHAVYTQRLLEFRRGEPFRRLGIGEVLGVAGDQLRVQTWGLLVLPLSALVAFPAGWAYAYYQTHTVLAFSRQTNGSGGAKPDDSWSLAQLWATQNHQGLALYSAWGLASWVGILGSLLLVPYLAIHLLGLENFFGLTPSTLTNTSLLAAVFVVSWLCTDPFVKAFYVLRVFHGLSAKTGEDLRQVFRKSPTRGTSLVIFAGLVLTLALPAPELRATPPENSPETMRQNIDRRLRGLPVESQLEPKFDPEAKVQPLPPAHLDPKTLDSAVRRTRRERDFQWRLKPKPPELGSLNESWFSRFMDQGTSFLKEFTDNCIKGIQKLWRKMFPSTRDRGAGVEESGTRIAQITEIVLYALIGLLLALLGYVVFLMLRQARRNAPGVRPLTGGVGLEAPDLEDASTHAAQLPEEEWLRLAREQMRQGSWRLAFRALFLAQLARLGSQGLLSLARHKTNKEYETELIRRCPGQGDFVEAFSSRRRRFDSVWYGHEAATEGDVRAWLSQLEEGGVR